MIQRNILNKLYTKDKLSMKEISSHLKISVGQVDYWMNRYNIKTRRISEAIYIKNNKKGDPFTIPKFVGHPKILKDKKFIYGLGLGLYWGEGTKRSKHTVRLGNSDPKLIRKFIQFLVDVFDIDTNKLRFGLQIFSDIDKNEALNFWVNSLKVEKSKFQKIVITKSGKIGNYKNKSKYGVLTLHFNNVKLRNFIFEKVSQL